MEPTTYRTVLLTNDTVQTITETKAMTALYMTHFLDMTQKRKEVVGIAPGLFRLIRLLAETNSVMTKTLWSWVFQGFSELDP